MLAALRKRHGTAGDGDNALVIDIGDEFGELDADAELDRWIAVTRLLSSNAPYVDLRESDVIQRRYERVVYSRVASIERAPGEDAPVNSNARLVLLAGHECSVNLVTSVSPSLARLRPIAYGLTASEQYFEPIDDTSEVSQGILNHRYLMRCRRVYRARTHLRFRAAGARSLYAPEMVLPVTIRASWRLWDRVLGATLIIVGILMSLISVLPDGDLYGFVRFSQRLGHNLDAARFWLRFVAIAVTTSGIGLTLVRGDAR